MMERLSEIDKTLVDRCMKGYANVISGDVLTGQKYSCEDYVADCSISLWRHMDFDKKYGAFNKLENTLEMNPEDLERFNLIIEDVSEKMADLIRHTDQKCKDEKAPFVKTYRKVSELIKPYEYIKAEYYFDLPKAINVILMTDYDQSFVHVSTMRPTKGLETIKDRISKLTVSYVGGTIEDKKLKLILEELQKKLSKENVPFAVERRDNLISITVGQEKTSFREDETLQLMQFVRNGISGNNNN